MWTAQVTVQDQSTKPLQGADVTITDRSGQTIFTGKTDDQGAVRAVLTEYVQTSEGRSYQTPHTVISSLDGYEPLSKTIDVRDKRALESTLPRE